MIVDKDKLVKSIEEAIKNGKKRNFVETVEMAVNLRNVDMKKPENRIDTVVNLPHGLGKPRKVGVFAKGDTALKAKEAGADVVITPEEIDELAKDKRRAKKLANSIDFFIAEAPLMPEIGRKLGPVLGQEVKFRSPFPHLLIQSPSSTG